ncbi:membrane protease YdiL (CAAX protease family) [Rheinheimera pacifica]|uniref:CPBP family intramembrane glutamic endopeptidase n=1 Tax=Rheinheimera pacifica TaxID=173990 RepID=UPI0028581056|nr:CPBP family intramembrane glutamic endopeptidase [Rheinheimera pacifica]MDR6985352.1 membrane protease YdiL (CAAX protease family) [Rheinheimera pacifica]
MNSSQADMNTAALPAGLAPTFTKSILWLLAFFVLYLTGAILYAAGYGVYLGSSGTVDPEKIGDVVVQHMASPMGLTLSYILITVFTLPFVLKAANLAGSPWRQTLTLKAVTVKQLMPWIALYLIFAVAQMLVNHVLEIDMGEFIGAILGSRDFSLLLVFVVAAPILEEAVFRGYLFKAWRSSFLGLWGTLLLTSVLFTLLHAGQYPGILLAMLFAFSLLLGLARERSGSLYVPMALHALNNLIAWILVVYLGLA